MTPRYFIKGCLATSVVLLLMFSMIEVVVRLTKPQPPIHTAQGQSFNRGQFTHPGLHPNHSAEYNVQVHVNQFGFVDREWHLPEDNATLLIGDSFVQAAQVELDQGIGRQLEARISTPVLSIGIPGAGTTTAYLALQSWITQLEPRRVLIGILVSNDILNNHPMLESKEDKPFATIQQDTLRIRFGQAPSLYLPTPLLNISHTARWFERTFEKRSQIQKKLSNHEYPLDYDIYRSETSTDSATWYESWDITERLFREIHQLCQESEVDVYFVLFPSRDEISTIRQNQIYLAYPQLKSTDFLSAHRELLGRLHTVVSPDRIIDLYPAFQSVNAIDELYFPLDGHWTTAGHDLAAETIAKHLEAIE